MTKPTIIALGAFAILIVVGMILLSQSPSLPMPDSVRPKIVDMNDMNEGSSTSSGLPVLAPAMPDFVGITHWWNTPDGQPLTPEKLKGKVVLLDFWTYSCINCIRTYPFLRAMQEKYADKGLVIIGVHTPEFAFEKEAANVERELSKNDLRYAVALDPEYGTWNAYGNRYWPAEYFFDREGRLRRTHFGEGEYEESEDAIRALLAEGGMDVGEEAPDVPELDFSMIETPETYFGLERGDAFMGTPGAEGERMDLTLSKTIQPNHWTAGGTWTFRSEFVEAESKNAVMQFSVQAAKLHVVMESADQTEKTIEISVDGVKTKTLKVSTSDLYTVAEFPEGGRHTVEIKVLDTGVRFYAATFS